LKKAYKLQKQKKKKKLMRHTKQIQRHGAQETTNTSYANWTYKSTLHIPCEEETDDVLR
jgi:hypothetical protein